ncbi:hypothetical protein [Nocardia aurantia]|uniref:D-alanyl-D-alanine carboxypeptidase n=1 Tax=Nocardia aurantia TaxID=2585199 RepID=A0A7K0DVE4_9NOCA|nr:hypothetical protein [Nocardia aurantia]MQY28804.1 hypothetical protein [Nocardia aurantia]
MSVTLTTQDKLTLRTAAYGAVSLLAAASGAPHKVATTGSVALTSATGLVGHVLAEKSPVGDLGGKSVAELADRVLPALTAAMRTLREQDSAEAENFRATIATALEAGAERAQGPAVAAMSRKITAALDAA